jgi:hypothetical protein
MCCLLDIQMQTVFCVNDSLKGNCIHDVFQTCQQIVSNHSLGYNNPQVGSSIFGYVGYLRLLRLLLKLIFLLLSFLLLPPSLSLSLSLNTDCPSPLSLSSFDDI